MWKTFKAAPLDFFLQFNILTMPKGHQRKFVISLHSYLLITKGRGEGKNK